MTEQIENPLLRKIAIPGETFKLPSGGLLYAEGVLRADVKNGEVTVNPMVAMDEILLKTPDKLFSGEAITEVFKHCIPQILNPLELYSKDVDFLLVCLRKVSYGSELDITTKHTCEGAKEHSYVIKLDKFIKETKQIDPTTLDQTFNLVLDNGQTVRLNPPTLNSTIQMFHMFGSANGTKEEERDKLEKELFVTVSGMIDSVDDITDKDMIIEWLQQIQIAWMYKISEQIEISSNWGPNTIVDLKCKDCKATFPVETPLNPLALFT